MELDTQSAVLVFKRTQHESALGPAEFLWTLQLPERKSWYPCVSLGFGKYNYRVQMLPMTKEELELI